MIPYKITTPAVAICVVAISLFTGCGHRASHGKEIYIDSVPEPSVTVSIVDSIPSLNLCQTEDVDFLDEEVSQMRIIPLETSEECLIGYISDLYVVGDTLVVIDGQKAKKIFLFNKGGKFLSAIGQSGDGPGEYSTISQAKANHDGIDIYDLQTNRYISYDYSGNEVRSATFNNTTPAAVMPQNDSVFLAVYSSYFKMFPFALQWIEGDSVAATAFPFKIDRREGPASLFQLNDNEIGLHIPATDTVYSISGKQIKPLFTLGLISEDESQEYQRLSAQMDIVEENEFLWHNKKAPACFVKVMPTQDYLIITHQKGIKSYISIVNRQSLQSRTYLISCMKPASLYMPPYLKSANGNTLVGVISDDYFRQIPDKSRKFIESHFSEQDRQILKNYDYANSNPIVWIMELK